MKAAYKQLPVILLTATSATVPALIAARGPHADRRFLEFSIANIHNPNTRRTYYRAVTDLLAQLIERHGQPSGTCQMIQVLSLIRPHAQERVRAAVAEATTLGGIDAGAGAPFGRGGQSDPCARDA